MSLIDNSIARSMKNVLERTQRREGLKGYLEVEIGLVVPSKDNPRQHIEPEELAELIQSIRTHGILQPLVVLRQAVGYEILAGHRRFFSAKEAGLHVVTVVIREGDDPQHIAELRLVENIQRQDLNPIELAEAYKTLLDAHGLTHDELAERINKDRSSITNALRLLALPENLREDISKGRLTLGHAKVLAGIQDPSWMQTLALKVIKDGLSVRVTENLARLGPPQTGTVEKAEKSPAAKELETNISYLLNTKVTIKERKGGKAALTMHFNDRDQLNRILVILSKVMDRRAPGS